MRARALLFAAAAAALVPASAHADEQKPAFQIGSKPAWYVMGGVTTGGTIVAQDRGWYVGGELSLVRLREKRFFGFYGDGYYDFGAKRTHVNGGIELGKGFLGIDAALATRIGGAHVEFGPTGRLFITTTLLTIYGRYIYFADSIIARDEHVVQIGGSFKLPFAAWGGN